MWSEINASPEFAYSSADQYFPVFLQGQFFIRRFQARSNPLDQISFKY